MVMSYTKALYYPTIDIKDEDWLKNAILFWDEISTIVPESVNLPYENRTSMVLKDEGILKPYIISANNPDIEKLEGKIKDFAANRDALHYFNHKKTWGKNPYSDKRAGIYLHREKLPLRVQEMLEKKDLIDSEGWVHVSNNFANYYMTLLATAIAKRKHLCLLTGDSEDYDLSSSYDFSIEGINGFATESIKKSMGDMVMFRLVVGGFTVNPLTSIDDLLKYKRKRKDELALFRSELGNLTSSVNFQEVESVEELKSVLEAKYQNDVLPALNDVKKTLSDAKVSWMDYLGQYITSFCLSANSFSDIGVGRLILGAGATLLPCLVRTFMKRRSIKRRNPYSYLLSLKADNIYADK